MRIILKWKKIELIIGFLRLLTHVMCGKLISDLLSCATMDEQYHEQN